MAIKNKRAHALRFGYVGLFSVVLTAALFIGFGQSAFAVTNPQPGSTGLQAKIPADPPKVGANITFPSNGQGFTTLPVKVGGTCVGDVLVKLFKNGVFSGSAQCTNNTFSLSTDLFTGKNDLTALVYDALDQAGPVSNTVPVTFTPAGFNTSRPRVNLTSDYAKRGANPGDTLVWPINLSGGIGPYAISVDWGDGTVELISRSTVGLIGISHKYSKPGVYADITKATDANGESAFLQLVAIANGALAQDNQVSASSTTKTKVVIIWWPVVVAVVMVIFSFWLGSRNKLENLRKQAEKRINY